MKNLENILEKIYQINQLAKSQKISEASFHKIIEMMIFWYKNRLKNYYPFVLMIIFIFFYLTMVFLEFYVLKNWEIWFFPFVIALFFAIMALKIVFQPEKYKKIQTAKIADLNFKILKFHFVPKYILQINFEIENIFKKKKSRHIFEISEKILKITEKISKYQKILPIFFRKDYIKSVNNLIFEEIQLLQNILEYSFENQVKNHEKLISEIENLQNSEWKNFSEILELQKIRLENQKHIFEKILKK